MRLGIISDVHGNLVALEAVLADLGGRAPDAVVNLGDCVTSPLWPRETLELLDTLQYPTVRGNHDRWIGEYPVAKATRTVEFAHAALSASQRAALGALPATLPIGNDVLAVHGRPDTDSEYLLEDKVDGRLCFVTAETLGARLDGIGARVVLCGHSHMQHTALAPGGQLVINPGSVGCPRYADNEEPFEAEAGSPHARYAIATKRAGRWNVELFALEYETAPVVARARENGFPGWATGFLSDPGRS
jgi:putative phosphoesterase